jgi:four helix bundle protein
MKYKRFEELPVWQAAVDYALLVFKFTVIADLGGFGDTKVQLERSALAISNSVAAGFERGAAGDLLEHLYKARGACSESRSILSMCETIPRFSNFRSELSNLKARAENISKQLYGWTEGLRNAPMKGNTFSGPKDDRFARDWEFDCDLEMDEMRRHHLEMLRRRAAETAMMRTVEEGS